LAKLLIEKLEGLNETEKVKLCEEYEKNKQIKIDIESNEITLGTELISFERYSETHTEEKYTPGVIEPSFGIGRITYCVLEHCFNKREKDERRTFFAFPPIIAPYKVSILPLVHDEEMLKLIEPIRKSLVANGVSYKIDDVADSVGRRYARTDEIGIPFGITIDQQTLKDKTVTLREILSMKQVRIHMNEVSNVLKDLCNDVKSWNDILKSYPEFLFKKKDD